MRETGKPGKSGADDSDGWSLDELERLIERRNKEAQRSSWGRRRRKRDADREWAEEHHDDLPPVFGWGWLSGCGTISIGLVVLSFASLAACS